MEIIEATVEGTIQVYYNVEIVLDPIMSDAGTIEDVPVFLDANNMWIAAPGCEDDLDIALEENYDGE